MNKQTVQKSNRDKIITVFKLKITIYSFNEISLRSNIPCSNHPRFVFQLQLFRNVNSHSRVLISESFFRLKLQSLVLFVTLCTDNGK